MSLPHEEVEGQQKDQGISNAGSFYVY